MITDQLLDQIATVIERAGLTADSVAALRGAFADLHFTHCLDDDIGAGIAPIRERDGFNLYLISNAGHCIAFAATPEAATGVVLAEVADDS